jgi:hypothetical protein
MPCRHLCLCTECSQTMRTSQLTFRRVAADAVLCPLCRGQALDFLELNIKRNISGQNAIPEEEVCRHYVPGLRLL